VAVKADAGHDDCDHSDLELIVNIGQKNDHWLNSQTARNTTTFKIP